MRWQSECLAAVTGITLSGQENTLLHIIRMHDRPKTIRDLAQMTNRQDIPNIQYDLRKLLKAGLIDKYGTARTGIYYITTDQGVRVCEDFAKLRSDVFLESARSELTSNPGPAISQGDWSSWKKFTNPRRAKSPPFTAAVDDN